MPVIPKKPQLVNRGVAGLLTKLDHAPTTQVIEAVSGKIDDVRCIGEIVDIDSLTPDPNNARLHPERNMEAIKDSFRAYGQRSCLIVRKQDRMVAKGNGSLEAAKALGWTKIAVDLQEMTDIEFTGYALADNRTAELAKWDFAVVARLDKLLLEANQPSVGWSLDELEVLRAADWTPPPINRDGFGSSDEGETDPLLVSFTPDQYLIVGAAIEHLKLVAERSDLEQAEAIAIICQAWLPEEAKDA